MKTATQIIVRIAFVAMLVIGAACNKVDHSALKADAATEARGELTAEQAQSLETERVHQIQDRVEYLQAQLKDVHPLNAKADVPGGDYIE
ncbi:MAG: hypothetical protein KKF77_10070 [Proteobacteria bacterium]|nr:hypothetical protein [Pseudomonadota bacterium]